ncbi:hypothetical protein B0H34DRAFT_808201 [Crassisporium funariophilum]|nr:hypothetical protein B0H34DRAFT_808201 [Crassisporium funariophilum]
MVETLHSDILEIIIQQLAEDIGDDKRINKEGLSACSLTCRAFLHLCRAHLFSEIVFARFGAGIGDNSHALLQNPSLAAHCQSLVLHLDPRLETGDMAEVLLQLKRLRSFTLCGHPLHGWNTFGPRMQGIPRNDGLPANLLSSCRNLEYLYLDSFGTIFTSASCLADLGPPPRLLFLSVRSLDPTVTSLLDIKRSETVPIIDISHLRRLNVKQCDTNKDCKILEKIILVVRKLECLDFGVSPPATFRNLARMLDFKSLTTLRSMQLRCSVEDEMQDLFSGLIEELEEMIRQNNTCLETLVLHLTIGFRAKSRFNDREWKRLDDVLGNPSAFPSLHSLYLKIDVRRDINGARRKDQQGKFFGMKTRQLTQLSSRQSRKFNFKFAVRIR